MSKKPAKKKIGLPLDPLHDRIVIQQLEAEEVSKGGIIIPDVAKTRPLRGLVVAAGKGRILENGGIRPIAVKVGQEVLFMKYAGSTVKIDDTEYLAVREEDVIGIIRKGK